MVDANKTGAIVATAGSAGVSMASALGLATAWTNPVSAGIAIVGIAIPALIKWAQGKNAYEKMVDVCKQYMGGAIGEQTALNYYYNLGFTTHDPKSAYWYAWDILITPAMMDYLYRVNGQRFIDGYRKVTPAYVPDIIEPFLEGWIKKGDGAPINNAFMKYMEWRRDPKSSRAGSDGSEKYYQNFFIRAENLVSVGFLPTLTGEQTELEKTANGVWRIKPTTVKPAVQDEWYMLSESTIYPALEWVKQNPMIAAIGAGLLLYLLFRK